MNKSTDLVISVNGPITHESKGLKQAQTGEYETPGGSYSDNKVAYLK